MSKEFSDQFQHLRYLRDMRTDLHQPELRVDLLKHQAADPNPQISQQARRLLQAKWELNPSKDAESKPSIDIMEQFQCFSKEEQESMLCNLAGIQLTEDCNSNCPFCMFGIKKGVEAKYSFESLSKFFHTYKAHLSRQFVLYWNSDPFDYKDGPHTFVDVYRLVQEIRPDELHFISTALPKGSEDCFLSFIRFSIKEQQERKETDLCLSLRIRISLGKHNIQRVENMFNAVTEALLSDGYTQREISHFYYACVQMAERIDDNQINAMGSLISKRDVIKDVSTAACSDGVIMTPKAIKAVMVTTPTIYEPSGEKNITLLPGEIIGKTPCLLNVLLYSPFYRGNSLYMRTAYRETIIPSIRTEQFAHYHLSDMYEDIILHLGRDITSFGQLINDIAELSVNPKSIHEPSSLKKEYLSVCAQSFRERAYLTRENVDKAQKCIASDALSDADKEKMAFYVFAVKAYLAKMDFLADQIEQGLSIEAISHSAKTLKNIGKEEISELPEIIEKLPKRTEDPKTHDIENPFRIFLQKMFLNKIKPSVT